MTDEQLKPLNRIDEIRERHEYMVGVGFANTNGVLGEAHKHRGCLLSEVDALTEALKTTSKYAELYGHNQGFQLAHERAKCGHVRANYLDPNWPESEENCICEFCDVVEKMERELAEKERWREKDWAYSYGELRDENQRLREALIFYADKKNWNGWYPEYCNSHVDGGKRAREALTSSDNA